MSMTRIDINHLLVTGGFEGSVNFWKLDMEQDKPLTLVANEKGHLKSVKRIIYNSTAGMISGGGDGVLNQWIIKSTGGKVG